MRLKATAAELRSYGLSGMGYCAPAVVVASRRLGVVSSVTVRHVGLGVGYKREPTTRGKLRCRADRLGPAEPTRKAKCAPEHGERTGKRHDAGAARDGDQAETRGVAETLCRKPGARLAGERQIEHTRHCGSQNIVELPRADEALKQPCAVARQRDEK